MATYKVMRPALTYAPSIWPPLASSTSINKLQVCLFVCGFVPYRQLELLAIEGLVPWVIICVCAGVT